MLLCINSEESDSEFRSYDYNISKTSYDDNISKKASKGIGAIKLIKRYIPKENLNDIYNALVKPHFDYCSLVLGKL